MAESNSLFNKCPKCSTKDITLYRDGGTMFCEKCDYTYHCGKDATFHDGSVRPCPKCQTKEQLDEMQRRNEYMEKMVADNNAYDHRMRNEDRNK